jgi:hypothetical protein
MKQLNESSAHGYLRPCVLKTPSSAQLPVRSARIPTYEAGVRAAQLTAVTSTSGSRHTTVRTLRDVPNIVCRTTAFPNPSGICQKQCRYDTRDWRDKRPRTILNHIWVGPESSLIWVMKHAAIKGKAPNMRLRSLYLPVRCTIHLRRVPT